MLNKNLLKAAIAKAGYTQGKLAECIGISLNTMSSRIVGKSHFNTDEIDKICSVLQITSNDDKANIFLGSPSQNRDRNDRQPTILPTQNPERSNLCRP